MRYHELQAFLDRVRSRWRVMVALRAWARSAIMAAAVLGAALTVQLLLRPAGSPFLILWAAATLVAVGSFATCLVRARRPFTDAQIARFIEEQCPELDDALVTAIEKGEAQADDPVVAAVVAHALRRVRQVDAARVIPQPSWHRAMAAAGVATVLLIVAGGFSTPPATRAARTLIAYVFPQKLTLSVVPGDTKVHAGAMVRIIARVPGNPDLVPTIVVRDGAVQREIHMIRGKDGYVTAIARVDRSFHYVVAAGSVHSPEYGVTVVRPPRVQRIDLRYEFPPGFHMEPRVEQDSGDIYAPAGTKVHVSIHADKPVTQAALNVAGHGTSPLRITRDLAEGDITIRDDGSYRVALGDADGLTNPGETEYFIRTIADRPPDVRIVRPASDRQVSPLEEVTVDARADDDHGVASFDLVYAVRGSAEKVVPFRRHGAATSVDGTQTIYLEDLRVQPGDFVAYYARARDAGRGNRATEARSDMFFLEVRPFDEEFVGSRTQGSGGGSGNTQSIDEIIQAQKDVITATWRLDRRARDAGKASSDDVKAVAQAQDEVKQRAAAVVSRMQRTADLRRRRRGGAQPPGDRSQSTDPPDEPMFRAMNAMDDARKALEALKTSDALPSEMTALNELLRAQAEVRRREVQRQQASAGGSGSADNRQEQDLSALFDRELTRQQQTNYETPQGTGNKDQNAAGNDALERIRELAKRQEAIAREQEQLSRDRDRLTAEELRRQLERLTREQSELRQQAEALARGSEGSKGSGESPARQALEQASKDMQSATNDLRRQDPGKASASGARAAQQLRQGEQQLGNGGAQADERGRQLGDMELEARQLADAERRLGAGGSKDGRGAATGGADDARQRAQEQERLADRAKRLEEGVRRLAEEQGGTPDQRDALKRASGDLQRLQLSEQMRKAAGAARRGEAGKAANPEELAKVLDDVAARLGSANGESDEARRLGEQLARVRDLRERLDAIDRQLSDGRRNGAGRGGTQSERGESTSSGGTSNGAGAGSSTDWQQAQELLEELHRQQIAIDTRDIDGFHPGKSAPGTEWWKQDYSRWDQLRAHAAVALEQIERSTAEKLRAEESKGRLNAGGANAVPQQYRELVDRYYRALASEPQAADLRSHRGD